MMKTLSRTLLACLLVAIIAMPAALFADQLLTPREVVIFPGVTTIEYGGHTLTFNTNSQLKAKFQMMGNVVELRVKATYTAQMGGGQNAPSQDPAVVIYSETLGEVVYEGSASDWVGLDLSEGGYTEK